jgi:hypothetical protein
MEKTTVDAAEAEMADAIGDAEIALRERIAVEPLALEEEFVNCPASIAWASARYAHALGVHLHARSRAKRLRGLLTLEHRQSLRDSGSKATVDEVAAAVDCDPRWVEADAAETNADVMRELAKGQLTALLAKRDMLVQLGASRRAEMERDPVIRSRQQQDRFRSSE